MACGMVVKAAGCHKVDCVPGLEGLRNTPGTGTCVPKISRRRNGTKELQHGCAPWGGCLLAYSLCVSGKHI